MVNSGAPTFALFNEGYEDFLKTGSWDLIFLVNVFEHLHDWCDFLDFVKESMFPGWGCVILCPDYSPLCEPIFRLPVLGNKSLTRTGLRKPIGAFESENDWEALCESLNFVMLRDARRATAQAVLKMTVRPQIVVEMTEGLETDAEFAKRQGSIAVLARQAKRSGVLHRLVDRPFVQNVMPYMKREMDVQR